MKSSPAFTRLVNMVQDLGEWNESNRFTLELTIHETVELSVSTLVVGKPDSGDMLAYCEAGSLEEAAAVATEELIEAVGELWSGDLSAESTSIQKEERQNGN